MIGVLNEDVGNEVLLNQVTSIQGDNGPSPHTLTDVRTEFLPAAKVSNFIQMRSDAMVCYYGMTD